MAGRHSEEKTVAVSASPVAIEWPALKHVTGSSTYVGLFINESDGSFYVTTDAAATTGPKIGAVDTDESSVPAGTFYWNEPVYLVAKTATSVTYTLVQAP